MVKSIRDKKFPLSETLLDKLESEACNERLVLRLEDQEQEIFIVGGAFTTILSDSFSTECDQQEETRALKTNLNIIEFTIHS